MVPAGQTSVNFTIGSDGSVESATTAERTLESKRGAEDDVERCVLGEIKRMKFEAPGSTVTVKYPFVMSIKE